MSERGDSIHAGNVINQIVNEQFIDQIHDAVIAYDAAQRIIFWNRSAEHLYGWDRDDVLGHSIDLITDLDTHSGTSGDSSNPRAELRPAGTPDGEVRHRHRNGSTLVIQSRIVPRYGNDGKFFCWVAINRDITMHRALQIKLNAHTTELERSNAELDNFARIASHDLREPLRMVGSYARLLDRRYRGQLDEAGGEFLDFIIDGAERMSTMIRDLLAVARAGSEPAEMKPVTLNDVVNDAVKDLDVAIRECNAEIIVGSLPTVMGDRTQLRRAFQNLIENALKFRGEQAPQVEITAERVTDIWQVSLSDNGLGISPADLNRIFIPNARGSQSAEISGSGTGLAVVRKIISGHGGRIWAESAEGQGSTFHVTFPAGEQETL